MSFVPVSLPILPRPLQSGETPLHAAAKNGNAPVVKLLLATPGVDPLARSVRALKCDSGARLPLASPLFLLQGGETPLEYAATHGNDFSKAAELLEEDTRVAADLANHMLRRQLRSIPASASTARP